MPTEELRQALRAAKVTNVETDFVDLLCKTFDAPRPLVLRILLASQAHFPRLHQTQQLNHEELPREVRDAIQTELEAGARRLRIRFAVEHGFQMRVFTAALVPANDFSRICAGCPKALECVANSLHHPIDCWEGRGAWGPSFTVTPIKINKNTVTVECEHPQGRYVLDVKDFDL